MKEYLEMNFQCNNNMLHVYFAISNRRKKDTNMSLFLEYMRFVDTNRNIKYNLKIKMEYKWNITH